MWWSRGAFGPAQLVSQMALLPALALLTLPSDVLRVDHIYPERDLWAHRVRYHELSIGHLPKPQTGGAKPHSWWLRNSLREVHFVHCSHLERKKKNSCRWPLSSTAQDFVFFPQQQSESLPSFLYSFNTHVYWEKTIFSTLLSLLNAFHSENIGEDLQKPVDF